MIPNLLSVAEQAREYNTVERVGAISSLWYLSPRGLPPETLRSHPEYKNVPPLEVLYSIAYIVHITFTTELSV